MAEPQSNTDRSGRFAAYIEARKFDPPRPMLIKAAGLAGRKAQAFDAGTGALNATKYLLSAGFAHVTALDASPGSQRIAAEMPPEQMSFVLSRFEDFTFPARRYDLVNAEFCLPFIEPDAFSGIFADLLGSVNVDGIFTGQLFGPHDSWNVAGSKMSFHTRQQAEGFFAGFQLVELTEEDKPGLTKLGEAKHWHIFHIIAKRLR